MALCPPCPHPTPPPAALAPGNKYYESSWRRDSASMPGTPLSVPVHTHELDLETAPA